MAHQTSLISIESPEYTFEGRPGRSGFEIAHRALCHDLLRYLRPFLHSIDPNWYSVDIRFPPTGYQQIRSQGKFPKVSVIPTHARLNGPRHGDLNFRDNLSSLVPIDLLALLKAFATVKHDYDQHWHIFLLNPRHRIQIIPRRTLILWENCAEAVACSKLDPKTGSFMVKPDPLNWGADPFTLTMAQVLRELAEGQDCEICNISYASSDLTYFFRTRASFNLEKRSSRVKC